MCAKEEDAYPTSWCQRLIDVEKHNCVLDRTVCKSWVACGDRCCFVCHGCVAVFDSIDLIPDSLLLISAINTEEMCRSSQF